MHTSPTHRLLRCGLLLLYPDCRSDTEYNQRYETCRRCKKWPDEGAAPAVLVCEEYIQHPLIERTSCCECPCCKRHDAEGGHAKEEPEESKHVQKYDRH